MGEYTHKQKTILRKLRIPEISTCGVGAQEGASVTIMKTQGTPLDKAGFNQWLRDQTEAKSGDVAKSDNVKKNGDLVALATGSTDGHQHGVSVESYDGSLYFYVGFAGGSDEEGSHDHKITSDTDGEFTVLENHGHTHEIDSEAVRNLVFALVAKTSDDNQDSDSIPGDDTLADSTTGEQNASVPTDTGTKDNTMDPEQLLAQANAKVATLEAEVALTKSVATLTDVEKTHYEGLQGDAQATYLAKSADDRKIVAKAAISEDPVVYTTTTGKIVRKSDGPLVLSLAQDVDAANGQIAKAHATVEKARIEKRASEEFAGLPGSSDTHAAVVKAFEGIEDQATRDACFAFAKAKTEGLGSITQSIGVSGAPLVSTNATTVSKAAEDKLDTLAKAKAASDDLNYFDAYDLVAKANPQLLDAANS